MVVVAPIELLLPTRIFYDTIQSTKISGTSQSWT